MIVTHSTLYECISCNWKYTTISTTTDVLSNSGRGCSEGEQTLVVEPTTKIAVNAESLEDMFDDDIDPGDQATTTMVDMAV